MTKLLSAYMETLIVRKPGTAGFKSAGLSSQDGSPMRLSQTALLSDTPLFGKPRNDFFGMRIRRKDRIEHVLNASLTDHER
jgi:hypothetical protein